MEPTLHHGDRVLFRRRFPRRQIAPGDIVAFNDPREGEHRLVMKRVHAVDGESVTVLGDNASASTDSRVFGPIPVNEITWLLVRRYHPGDA